MRISDWSSDVCSSDLGRIGGAQALLGSLLSIKPIVDISTGVVEEAGKARTRGKALQVLVDKVFAGGPVEHVCVTHGLAPQLEQSLDLLRTRSPPDQDRARLTVPVIGAPSSEARRVGEDRVST